MQNSCAIKITTFITISFYKIELLQCIPHPSSVWCAYGIPSDKKDGDFVTCGHDGILRLFSKQTIQYASPDEEQRVQVLQINFMQQVFKKLYKIVYIKLLFSTYTYLFLIY